MRRVSLIALTSILAQICDKKHARHCLAFKLHQIHDEKCQSEISAPKSYLANTTTIHLGINENTQAIIETATHEKHKRLDEIKADIMLTRTEIEENYNATENAKSKARRDKHLIYRESMQKRLVKLEIEEFDLMRDIADAKPL